MPGLDNPLRVLTSYRLRRTMSSAMSSLNPVFAEFGLRRTTYATLAVVVENPGQRQGKVAEALAIERPNFVQIVGELEKSGLISRQTAADDKRAYALHATAHGEQLYSKASRAVRERDLELIRGLTAAQIEALHSALAVIVANSKCREVQDDC